MKRLSYIVVSIIIFAACSITPDKEVAKVAQKYLDAAGNYKFDQAREYVTDSSQYIIDIMENFTDLMPEEDIKKNLPVQVTLGQISIIKDTARVEFVTKSPIYTHENNIFLVKNGEKWEVDLSKSFTDK